MSEHEWMPVSVVCHHLGVTRQAVHQRIGDGKLTVWTVNPRRGDLVVLARDVAIWERERREATP